MTQGAKAVASGITKRSSKPSKDNNSQHTRTSPRGNPQQESLDRGTSLVSMDVLSPLIEPNISAHSSTRAYAAITRTGVASPPFAPSPELLAEGQRVLETVRDSPKALGNLVKSWYTELGDTPACGPLVKVCWAVTHDLLVPCLRADSSPQNLAIQSMNMFEQTSLPPQWPLSPADQRLERALSVDGVRWEVVGIYFGLVGMVMAPMRDGADGIDLTLEKWGPTRKAAMERSLQSCVQCYTFCERIGQFNDLTIWLLTMAVQLATWCYGDDSFQAWRLMGDLASVVTALNFHKACQDGRSIPLYLLELRKRAIEGCHELDKGLSTFIGRTPRLHMRYCGLELPLDLSDDVLFGTPEALESAIKELDSEGWNTTGSVYPASRIRAAFLLIKAREEAVELSLSSSPDDVRLQSQRLLHTSVEIWESLPTHLKYKPSFWETMSPSCADMLLMLRLESLYSDFLLQKLIVNQDHASRNTLIETSHTILGLVLSALNKRLFLSTGRINLEWSMINYAMPCASILILELIRQSEQPAQPAIINRSTLIQDLSVLISCCDWLTEPDQQNYALCKQAQSLFSRSLDRILNHTHTPAIVPATTVQARNPHDSLAADGLAQDSQLLPVDEAEWLAWLETCDLSVDPWLDLLADNTQALSGDLQPGSSGNACL